MQTRLLLFLLVIFVNVSAQETRFDWLRKIKSAPDDTAKVTLYGKTALAYAGINYDSGFYYAEQGLTLARSLGEPLYTGKMYNVYSALLVSIGEYELCKTYADSAKTIALAEDDKMMLSGVYNTYGNLARVNNQLDSAIYFYSASLELKRAVGDRNGEAGCLNGIGYCYYAQGNLKSAVEYYYQAIPIREELNDKKGLANIYLNIAFVHLDLNEMKPAIEALDKAYPMFSDLGITESMANAANAYGVVYMENKDYSNALAWYHKALELRMVVGDSSGIAESYNNIGNIFNVKNEHDSALFYYRKALALRQHTFSTTQVQFLCNFAISASKTGMADSARWALNTAEEITNGAGRPELFVALYGAKGDYYEAIGKFDSALYFVKSSFLLSDSLYRDESTRAFGELETKYQTEKKQKEIDNLTAAQNQKDLQLISLSVGIGLLLILIGYVIYVGVQRKKTNKLLAHQNHEISVKNKDITDSITYARRIQQSVLPDEEILFRNTTDAFILYQPRDIVSGDFYWFRKEGQRLYIAAADCTGHGVPGALVSVIGVNLLEQIVTANNTVTTGVLLDELHKMMYVALHKDSLAKGSSDGMDIALICIDRSRNVVEFSGASRPMLHYNGSTLEQIKGDRYSIGGVKDIENSSSYRTAEFEIRTGDAFYLFTDGFADQFGGPSNKKFMTKNFNELIAKNAGEAMKIQQDKTEEAFRKWMGKNEQVDDILVIGVRL